MRNTEQRPIKFRAWVEGEGHWFMTYDLAFDEYEPLNDQLAYQENLMQYTGLKDKNGKEIYEGDIAKDFQGKLYYVLWDDAGFSWAWYQNNYPHGLYKSAGSETINWQRRIESCEVIGNIYENSELLK